MNPNKQTRTKIEDLRQLSNNTAVNLGIIIMEMRDGFQSLVEFVGISPKLPLGNGYCNNVHILGM